MTSGTNHLIAGSIITSLGFVILHFYGKFELKFLFLVPYIIFLSDISDIDIKKSKARKVFNLSVCGILLVLTFFAFLKNIYYFVFFIPILILFIIVHSLTHRKQSHTILFGIIVSLPLLYFSFYLFLVGFGSYLSHLTLDGI